MPLFLIVIVVAGSFLTVGMLYKGKTIATRLWRTDEDPGQRQTPIGQEMRLVYGVIIPLHPQLTWKMNKRENEKEV